MTSWAATGLLIAGGYWVLARNKAGNSVAKQETEDPGLFRKHTTYESFTTSSGFVYPKIRVFFQEHPQAGKLPKDLPLLVFVHGLGGNATQFSSLLTSLTNIAPCLAIDFPGCGLSEFAPDDISAYTQTAFAELLAAAILRYRDAEINQQVVLVGHSMGCTTSSLLASSTSPLAHLVSEMIIGFVAICPPASPPSDREVSAIQKLKWMPASVFDLLRLYDRRGGLESKSVSRVVGKAADIETKRLQEKYNAQSKSAVFLRVIRAALLPLRADSSSCMNGWPGRDIWGGIRAPLFLVTGESDTVTRPEEVEVITKWLTETKRLSAGFVGTGRKHSSVSQSSSSGNDKGESVPTTVGDAQMAQDQLTFSNGDDTNNVLQQTSDGVTEVQTSSKHAFALKAAVFPEPAGHGLMYAASTVRVLSSLMEDFFAHHVDERLAPGWQLQHMTTSGKWDVKNLKKWQSVDPCSEPIAGVFRAMKTMREVDELHCPKTFVKRFSSSVLPDGVAMIVDISHESPVYDPKGLEESGVKYHKFPTVSKLPPTPDEVKHFVSLIDELRSSPELTQTESQDRRPTIGVHCHYGFNRTGMFIVSYLVERLGYRLQDALEEFEQKRPPGIKHEHFVNELFMRYAVSMKRRETLVE